MIAPTCVLSRDQALREISLALREERVPLLDNADLRRTNLYALDLSGGDFIKADLSDANLQDTYLSGAYMEQAVLCGANISRANLSNAYMVGVT